MEWWEQFQEWTIIKDSMKDIKNHSKEPNRLYISKGKVPELDDFGNKEI